MRLNGGFRARIQSPLMAQTCCSRVSRRRAASAISGRRGLCLFHFVHLERRFRTRSGVPDFASQRVGTAEAGDRRGHLRPDTKAWDVSCPYGAVAYERREYRRNSSHACPTEGATPSPYDDSIGLADTLRLHHWAEEADFGRMNTSRSPAVDRACGRFGPIDRHHDAERRHPLTLPG